MYYVELPENCDNEIVNFVKTCREELIPIDNFHLFPVIRLMQTINVSYLRGITLNLATQVGFLVKCTQNGAPATPNIKPGVLLTNPIMYQ